MTITELVTLLEDALKTYGDIEVTADSRHIVAADVIPAFKDFTAIFDIVS